MSSPKKAAEESQPRTLAARLVYARQHIGSIEKTGHNKHLNYAYRTEDDLFAGVRPALDEAGVMMLPSVSDVSLDGGQVSVWMDVEFTDVVTSESKTIRGFGQDKNAKAAQTGALRYVLQKTFMIATGEDDEADNGRPEPARPSAPRPVPVPAPANPNREKLVQLLKRLAQWAEVSLQAALEKAEKASTDDLTDAELAAWIRKMRTKIGVVSRDTAATLRDVLQARGEFPVLSDLAISALEELSEREAEHLLAQARKK
jgi:hypothetical protein